MKIFDRWDIITTPSGRCFFPEDQLTAFFWNPLYLTSLTLDPPPPYEFPSFYWSHFIFFTNPCFFMTHLIENVFFRDLSSLRRKLRVLSSELLSLWSYATPSAVNQGQRPVHRFHRLVILADFVKTLRQQVPERDVPRIFLQSAANDRHRLFIPLIPEQP